MAECPICLEFVKNIHITKCNHNFCGPCIKRWMETNESCPMCHTGDTLL